MHENKQTLLEFRSSTKVLYISEKQIKIIKIPAAALLSNSSFLSRSLSVRPASRRVDQTGQVRLDYILQRRNSPFN